MYNYRRKLIAIIVALIIVMETVSAFAVVERHTIGETIKPGFMEFRLSSMEIVPELHSSSGSGMMLPKEEKSQYYIIRGTIESYAGRSFDVNNFRAEMTFNGTYTYDASAMVECDGHLQRNLDPLADGIYVIYAKIPEKLVSMVKTCDLVISFNKDFASRPAINKGDYNYTFSVDEKTMTQAKQKTNAQKAAEQSRLTPRKVSLGSTIKTKNCTMSLDSYGFEKKLYSYIGQKKKPSIWFSITAGDGNTHIYLMGNFKNTSGVERTIRRIYCEFEINETYYYTAEVNALEKKGKNFEWYVSPLAEMQYIAYAEIPESLARSMSSCIVRIGFTDDFQARETKNGRLFFDKCSEIYEAKLK